MVFGFPPRRVSFCGVCLCRHVWGSAPLMTSPWGRVAIPLAPSTAVFHEGIVSFGRAVQAALKTLVADGWQRVPVPLREEVLGVVGLPAELAGNDARAALATRLRGTAEP